MTTSKIPGLSLTKSILQLSSGVGLAEWQEHCSRNTERAISFKTRLQRTNSTNKHDILALEAECVDEVQTARQLRISSILLQVSQPTKHVCAQHSQLTLIYS